MTCESRSFRAPPGFYLVHASGSLSFSEWCAGSMWIADRFGTAIICLSFDLCRAWCGQIVCGVRIDSALTASSDPWYLGDVAWELEGPVPCAHGVTAKGSLGMWPVSEEAQVRYREGVRSLRCSRKMRVENHELLGGWLPAHALRLLAGRPDAIRKSLRHHRNLSGLDDSLSRLPRQP
jgi:hypothetical protein